MKDPNSFILGRMNITQNDQHVSNYVLMHLIQPHLNTGINITTDYSSPLYNWPRSQRRNIQVSVEVEIYKLVGTMKNPDEKYQYLTGAIVHHENYEEW
jgi:hypothetical protein